MNHRERFHATMHYLPRDRPPRADFGFWDETLVIWRDQGLPVLHTFAEASTYFGMDYGLDEVCSATGVGSGLSPGFPWQQLEDRGDHEVVQQDDGVRVLRRKFLSSIPMPVAHLLTDRTSWREHYAPRLDPDATTRYPADLAERARTWTDPKRTHLIALPGGSLYGSLRNWMGLEQLSLVVYDDPAFFEEMVTTMADCIVGTLTRLLETGGQFDACAMWEDMCYNAGPLLSPRHFKRYLVPHYRRIADLLHRYGVDVLWVDCDGKIDELLPLWLDAGVNCMFPIEVGNWGADPVQYRKLYGRDLLMIGGFDKHILAQSYAAIDHEIERLAPLVAEGGYMPLCDHRVPPDVPLAHYRYFLERARAVWG